MNAWQKRNEASHQNNAVGRHADPWTLSKGVPNSGTSPGLSPRYLRASASD